MYTLTFLVRVQAMAETLEHSLLGCSLLGCFLLEYLLLEYFLLEYFLVEYSPFVMLPKRLCWLGIAAVPRRM